MEKKNKASKQRIKKAHDEGQVSKSQDLLRLAGLAAAFELANLFYQPLIQLISQLFMMPSQLFTLPFSAAVERLGLFALSLGLSICMSAMMVLIIVKLLFTWFQTGFVFSAAPFTKGFSQLNPAKQLAQMFTMNKLWDVFAALIKLFIILGLGSLLHRSLLADLFGMPRLESQSLWYALHSVFLVFERSLLVALIAIALVDIAMQRHFYQKRLKMSDEEVKQERKNRDGDPMIKSARRSMAQKLLMEPPKPELNSVQQADVVVVNPTHIAIALSYKPEDVPLPVVLYKSVDASAQETIQYAKDNAIPVVRYLWLARTLHENCLVGQTIPRETIQSAAALFKVIKQLQQGQSDAMLNNSSHDIVEMN